MAGLRGFWIAQAFGVLLAMCACASIAFAEEGGLSDSMESKDGLLLEDITWKHRFLWGAQSAFAPHALDRVTLIYVYDPADFEGGPLSMEANAAEDSTVYGLCSGDYYDDPHEKGWRVVHLRKPDSAKPCVERQSDAYVIAAKPIARIAEKKKFWVPTEKWEKMRVTWSLVADDRTLEDGAETSLGSAFQ